MLLPKESTARNIYLTGSLTLLTLVFFVIDLTIPLGVAGGVPYTLVVFLSGWLHWRRATLTFAVATSVLVALGFMFSPPTEELWKALVNRGLALLVIWGTAVLLLQRRKIEDELKSTYNQLERWAAEREAQLTGVLRYVPEAVIIIDESGIIDSINDGAQRIFEYSPNEICGKNVSILMPEPHKSRHDEYIDAYKRTGKGQIIDKGPREVEGLTRRGTIVPLDLNVGRMDVNGKLMFIGIARDITKRKKEREQERHSQKLRALGQLTSGVAHDFNNLLTIILGNLEMAEDYVDTDSAIKEYLDAVNDAGTRAANLTRHLLAYSRKQVLDPEIVDVNKLVASTAELLRRTLGEHIELEIVSAAGLWNVFADKGQLENCLLNLGVNARDAMPEGGKLTIETANTRLDREYAYMHKEVSPGEYVMIALSDTGPGIPEEIIDKIFDPFFTTKEVGEGTGLGLSMIYGFVKQSGGHINVYSEAGQGTTIKMYLPRNGTGEAKDHDMFSANINPVGDETILVIEDDAGVRHFAIDALEMLGYTVVEAEDGPQALELIRSIPKIDLLLTDVVLPHGMNGREVANEILKTWPDIPILFMSGYTENAIVHQGILDQHAELLMKPYTRAQLGSRVRGLLDQARELKQT